MAWHVTSTHRMVRPFVLIGIAGLAVTGCVSTSPREAGYMLGTLAGAATGVPIGPVVGAAAGTLIGRAMEAPLERRRVERERDTLERDLGLVRGDAAPSAATDTAIDAGPVSGQVERVWMDEQFRDGRVIPGRFEQRHAPAGGTMATAAAGQAS